MRVDLFDFDLPEERIALRPENPRDAAKLLVVRRQGMFEDRVVRDLPSLLDPGDLLVFNDTKVIPAQLTGIRRRGDASAQVDATLHMRVSPDRWLAFMRPGKRVAAGDRIHFGHDGNSCFLGQLAETGHVSQATAAAINAARARGNRVVCVGTTSLRLLESAASEDGQLSAWSGATDIFITPGYRFRVADALMTNFHLPRSTLFMLVSAFSGLERMRAAYSHAIGKHYRFYSYGDASLLFRAEE